MFSSPYIDIALGLAFIYCLLSLLATTFQEIVATWMGLRSKTLREGITRMLEDPGTPPKLVDAFYKHPLIRYMGRDEKTKSAPSYISKQNFAKVVVDLLRGYAPDGQNLDAVIADASGILPPDTRKLFQSFWQDAKGDVAAFQRRLEQWFDDSMHRVTGWYKRSAQRLTIAIGLGLAIFMNADTFEMVQRLTHDDKARQGMVSLATSFSQDVDKKIEIAHSGSMLKSQADTLSLDSLKHVSDSLMQQAGTLLHDDFKRADALMGLGWKSTQGCHTAWYRQPFCYLEDKLRSGYCADANGDCALASTNFVFWLLKKILGWMVTALAVALGSPFWFDILNKLVKLRGTGTKPEEKPAGKPAGA